MSQSGETHEQWARRMIEERGYMPANKAAEVRRILDAQWAEDVAACPQCRAGAVDPHPHGGPAKEQTDQ